MAEGATLLVDVVLPHQPIRQWVLSFPYQLRFLFASRSELMCQVPGIVYRAIASHFIKKAGRTQKAAKTAAVMLIQSVWTVRRPGCAKSESERGPVHFHMLFVDGIYAENKYGKTIFQRTSAMTWAQRLKRVFNIDVETCAHCGEAVKVIACIEDQQAIDKI